jgi:hypothetical protein
MRTPSLLYSVSKPMLSQDYTSKGLVDANSVTAVLAELSEKSLFRYIFPTFFQILCVQLPKNML